MLLYLLLQGVVGLASAQAFLAHGYSVIVQPPSGKGDEKLPSNGHFKTANFFSYATTEGYISFGWFLPATVQADSSICLPNSTEYDWFEYSTGQCDGTSCKLHAVNYERTNPTEVSFEGPYIINPVVVDQNDVAAQFALSYVDESEDGFYAVGSRRPLSGTDDPSMKRDCEAAFMTLSTIQDKYQLPIPFNLTNPCGLASPGLIKQNPV